MSGYASGESSGTGGEVVTGGDGATDGEGSIEREVDGRGVDDGLCGAAGGSDRGELITMNNVRPRRSRPLRRAPETSAAGCAGGDSARREGRADAVPHR
jgi:hypothetical protein